MEIKLAENLKLDICIPIKSVERFQYLWKPDYHAHLQLAGYMNRDIQWNPSLYYDSNVKLWRNINGEVKILFQGCLTKLDIKNIGDIEIVFIEVTSASCQLDRKISSRSFQKINMTYGEVVRIAVQDMGGQIIRNQESDQAIGTPVFQNKETVWQFASRLAERLKTSIISDIETGRPNFWFGMRKGKEVEPIFEDGCTIQLFPIGKKTGMRFQVKGQILYKIGDFTTYMGQRVTITEIEGHFNKGEFFFIYTLEDVAVKENICAVNHPAGEGYWGTILEVREESIKLALDIDHGEDTGEYFYPWRPATGNALYAMPEKGAKALLFFFKENQQEGAIIHCLNEELEAKRDFRNKELEIQNENSVALLQDMLSFSKGNDHKLLLSDSLISTMTAKSLKISAEGKIRLKAEKISIETPDELNICQG